MSLSAILIFILSITGMIAVIPVTCWGWVQWLRRGRLIEKSSWLSLTALALASASLLIAIVAIAKAHPPFGFEPYNPQLVMFFRYGARVSILGFLIGSIGLFFKNPLRWQGPVSSLCMSFFWIGIITFQ
jgi:hypothetical protein